MMNELPLAIGFLIFAAIFFTMLIWTFGAFMGWWRWPDGGS
jgi:hypothetical protein